MKNGVLLSLMLKARLFLSALLRDLLKTPKMKRMILEALRLHLYLGKSLLQLHLSIPSLLPLNITVNPPALKASAAVKLCELFKTNRLEGQSELTSRSRIASTRLTTMKAWLSG
jgi:hypothetical protein